MTRSVFNHRRSTSRTSYRDEVLSDSPRLYWRLDEPSSGTAADSSGNGRTGSYNPGPATITRGVTSPIASDASDKAITFVPNGNGDCMVYSAASTAWDDASMSIEAWIKPLSGKSVKHGIAAVMDSGGSARWYFRVQPSTGNLETYPNTSLSLGTTISFNVWTHLIVTFDAVDSKFRVYINGALNFTSAASSLGAATNKRFTIGHNNADGFGGEEFNGSMDEVALYGTALSATRIAAHYAAAL